MILHLRTGGGWLPVLAGGHCFSHLGTMGGRVDVNVVLHKLWRFARSALYDRSAFVTRLDTVSVLGYGVAMTCLTPRLLYSQLATCRQCPNLIYGLNLLYCLV